VIRVLVAATAPIVRAGLESLFSGQSDFELAGSIANLSELAAAIEERQPDVVVIAPRSGLDDSAEEASAVSTSGGPPYLVLLLDNAPAGRAAEALRLGVRGVLPTDLPPSEMLAAVSAVGAGLVVLDPSDVDRLLARPEQAFPTESQVLTTREVEVLRMLAEGLGNKTIAWKLGISEHTVKYHVASIMSKLNAGSRTEAVTAGIRRGLIFL